MKFTRITVDPQQMGGVPCIRGLRIPVATVVGMIADGVTNAEILAAYPDLQREDIPEALRYAAEAVRERELPLTIFGVSMALQRHPELTRAFVELGHEIACHGWRWIHYQNIDEATEREHMRIGMQIIKDLTGEMPLGWYTGRDSPNTRRLVVEHGGFLYDSDYYGDDLPFWTEVEVTGGEKKPHLVVPYTLDSNDMRFATPQGFNTGEQFFQYLKDAFDVLYDEGDPSGQDSPKMLSIGMHCRLLGRPGRFRALQRFLDYVQGHDKVWICRRVDIARHWAETHPYTARKQA